MSGEHPVVRMYRTYGPKHRSSFFVGAVCLGLTNYLAVTIPMEIGRSIDMMQGGESILVPGLMVASMGVGVIIVRTLSRILFFNPGRDIEYDLRNDLFACLMHHQPQFFAERQTGDIVSRASNDISWTRALVGYGTLQAINMAFALPMAFWKMFGISVTLSLVALAPVLVGLLLAQGSIRQLFPLIRRNQEQLGDLSNHIVESFHGIGSIQGFVAEDAFRDVFEERNEAWFWTGMKLSIIRTVAFPLIAMAGGVSVFLLVYVGGSLAISGAISVGELVAFVALLAMFIPYLRSMGFMFSVWQRGRAALIRIFEIMDVAVDRPEGEAPTVMATGTGPSIRVNALTFCYPDQPNEPALTDVSFEVGAGQTVGIFGRTGSGKTTLLRMLARLYNPPPGTVYVDDVDIRCLDLDAWRRRLSVVPQRAFLFSDSVASNVSLQDEPDEAGVTQATNLASLSADLASLPKGLQTVVGERGIMLSGGQRQRVALARGLYRASDMILLDDVLSAVDHDNEAKLVSTLANLRGRNGQGGLTTFIVSNRLSAFRYADSILVLESGRLVAHETHETLISVPGVYRDTWHVQREQESVEEYTG